MQVIYTPQQSNSTIKYQFGKSVILATVDGEMTLFDLSEIREGQKYQTHYPLMEVRKKDGQLAVVLIYPEEARFEVDNEKDLTTNAKSVKLKPLSIEKAPPSETEILKDEIKVLRKMVQDLSEKQSERR